MKSRPENKLKMIICWATILAWIFSSALTGPLLSLNHESSRSDNNELTEQGASLSASVFSTETTRDNAELLDENELKSKSHSDIAHSFIRRPSALSMDALSHYAPSKGVARSPINRPILI